MLLGLYYFKMGKEFAHPTICLDEAGFNYEPYLINMLVIYYTNIASRYKEKIKKLLRLSLSY